VLDAHLPVLVHTEDGAIVDIGFDLKAFDPGTSDFAYFLHLWTAKKDS
jgi:hypothetical protein